MQGILFLFIQIFVKTWRGKVTFPRTKDGTDTIKKITKSQIKAKVG